MTSENNKNSVSKNRWRQLAGLKEAHDLNKLNIPEPGVGNLGAIKDEEPHLDPWDFSASGSGDPKKREGLAYILWDLYKEVHGTRPRHIHFASMSEEELRSEIDALAMELDNRDAWAMDDEESIPPEDEKHFVGAPPSEDEINDMAKHYGYDSELDNLPTFGGNKLKEAGGEPESLKKMTDEAMAKASQILKLLSGMDKPLGSNEHVDLLSVIMDATQEAYDMGHDDGYIQAERDIHGEHESEDRLEHERSENLRLNRLEEEDESGIKDFYSTEADKIEKALNSDAKHLFNEPVGSVVRPLANIIGQVTAHKEPFHVRQAKSMPKGPRYKNNKDGSVTRIKE